MREQNQALRKHTQILSHNKRQIQHKMETTMLKLTDHGFQKNNTTIPCNCLKTWNIEIKHLSHTITAFTVTM